MPITVRAETPADYHAVAEIQALAFNRPDSIGEILFVDAQRHGARYNPDLSLVAEVDGRVVGHAFFYPHTALFGGQPVEGVSLAPLAVRPGCQKAGVGSALMDEGHRRAQALGFHFSFLLGHPSYYPRFGYRTRMFGACRLNVARAGIPEAESPAESPLDERQAQEGDLPALAALWRQWFADVDLALVPEPSILSWVAQGENIRSLVALEGGEVAGYLRYRAFNPADVLMFLARDAAVARRLLAQHAARVEGVDALALPLHPDSRAARELLALPYTTYVQAWEAGMILPLEPRSPSLNAYMDGVAAGTRKPGLLIYPPMMELA